MFTGIIETQGRVIALTRGEAGARLTIETGTRLPDLTVGESIAVNGACLTVVQGDGAAFTTDLSSETLAVTTLGDLKLEDRVNLERPLKVGDRLGGHFVTGHVDGVGRTIRRQPAGDSLWMWIGVPPALDIYLAPKGSIAVDGVSLTLVEVSQEAFSVCLVPHTLAITTLGWKGPGSLVNIEVDVLSRYLERLLSSQIMRDRSLLTAQFLREQGFA
ncbi:MAG: riboflavin synthase [candidate division NC10 bacterium]|nr:riboflavin synthase [candidate division NC10 bacterium]